MSARIFLAWLPLLAGCAYAPRVIEDLRVYPDQSTPEASFLTYARAAQAGDLAVMEGCLGYVMAREFLEARRTYGDEDLQTKLVETGRDRRYEILDVHTGERNRLAYLDVLATPAGGAPTTYVFSFLNRSGIWKLLLYQPGSFEHARSTGEMEEEALLEEME